MSDAIFAGRTALVTGASRGIGAATARTIAAHGAFTIIHYAASQGAAEAVVDDIRAAGGRAATLRCDLSDSAAIPAMFTEVDALLQRETGATRLDFLVNNAGVGKTASISETTPEDWDQVMDLNMKALFFVSQQAIDRLGEGGRIVNIGSVNGRGAQPARAVYSASKIGVKGLTRSFAAALGARGITVNAIAPGAVATDFTTALRAQPQIMEQISGMTAMGRIGEPQDIADSVLLLLRPEAHWITGQTIEASGGLRL